MPFLKNFFVIFFVFLLTTMVGRFVFAFYLFSDIGLQDKVYAVCMGYKFDFAISAVVAFLATLFEVNKKTMVGIASVLTVVSFGFQIADIMYFYDSGRHISYEIKDVLVSHDGLLASAINRHFLLVVFSAVFLLLLFCFSLLVFKKALAAEQINKFYFLKKIVIIGLFVFFVRGMFQHVPLNPWHSNQLGSSSFASIALNSSYNVLYTNVRSEKNLKRSRRYVTYDEIESVKKLYEDEGEYVKKLETSPNIVLFFLESWSAMHFKSYGGQYDIVPNFERLLQLSVRPKGLMANGHRTPEGVFVTLASFNNPLGRTVAKNKLQSFQYRSLINVLHEHKKYSSAFFQGTNKETAGVGSLAQSLGCQSSYGKHDVQKRVYEENGWGVHDKDLYNFAFEKIQAMEKPFIIGINGATTHDLLLPKGVETFHFVDDKELNAKLNTFYYSDKWTYEFVRQVQSLYPDTLFVFLADHCGWAVPNNNFLHYLIPFAIYSEKLEPLYIDEFVSQKDIAPTIIDLVLGDYRKIAPSFSGKSIIRKNTFFADYYHNGVLGVVKDKISIELTGDNMQCYDVSTFRQRSVKCQPGTEEFMNQIKSFTNITQDLLFSGKTMEFKNYR